MVWRRAPVASMGRMRSASPWRTRAGTSTLATSAVKSVSQVGGQARVAMAEARAATFQLAWMAASLIRSGLRTSALKNVSRKSWR